MITRRNFVRKTAGWLGLSPLLPYMSSCEMQSTFKSNIAGQNAVLAHRLRTMDFGSIVSETKTDIVIAGGGISGLSAARILKKQDKDFVLLELSDTAGGNARGGKNAISAFPWGAHYLPLPGKNDPELLSFLQEAGSITGYTTGLPVYNEYHLCFDPKERLFINHFWQEGIVPHAGVPQRDRDEIQRFLELMNDYKNMKGSDGLDAFSIPVSFSSQDKNLLSLDDITMAEFLRQSGFQSPYLLWYVNYCCADDFGSSIHDTSAWAGLHYFASRKGHAANAPADSVLTWPEGNAWLANKLINSISGHIQTNSLVYKIVVQGDRVNVFYFDGATNSSKKLICSKLILATPQFINQRLLQGLRDDVPYNMFGYAPWLVANISLNSELTERRGEPLCWDNVIYGSDSLGYVNASHQHPKSFSGEKVITWYKPMLGSDISTVRAVLHQMNTSDMSKLVLDELHLPHPTIHTSIKEIDFWVWGHGMIRPVPGTIHGEHLKRAARDIGKKIFFAHSDLSGLSIFEEAFYRGHTTAYEALSA